MIVWDAQLPSELFNKWLKWESKLPASVSTARALPKYREEVSNIDLHCFGDVSGSGVSAAVYAVVSQPSGNSVGLVAARARLAKQGLTIPHLELVSGHMAMNLIVNVKEALEGFPVERDDLLVTGAAKWLKAVMVDEKVHNFLPRQGIQWQFNLSRAP